MLYIQASNPRRRERVETALSLGAAVRAAFERHTESIYVVWRGVPVRIGYAEPLGVLLPELLGMLERLLAEPAGGGDYGITEDGLSFRWRLAWSDGNLTIHGQWFVVPGELEAVLAERAEVSIPVADFLAEWKVPLRNVIEAIDGVAIEGAPQAVTRLKAIEAAIPRPGWLYAAEVQGAS
jgi:hypothetical protein